GRVWVSDANNDRVQRWLPDDYETEEPLAQDDPKVEVKTSEGLVEAVEGEEAGQTTYSHEGEMLSAVDGPQGETEYEYDSEERLTKVTLPNGTWGEVKYDEAGRAKSVTVDPSGEKPANNTYFYYKEEPRRTTVDPEGEPATVYDIGPDGSVLKWWNTETPPEIQIISGSLYQNKETAQPIEPGDYELEVLANHVEGIASIDIVANGSHLVSEKTCEQDYETEEVECKAVEDLWVTNTGNWPPGVLNLEVIVTDANGNAESARFWVNIPYTPPPDPEADEPPKFEEVLDFREEFGLDLDLEGDEKAIAERIFNLIGAWYNPHTPNGEVARATWERWGVPLRAVDAAELEYREWLYGVNADRIDLWVESTSPSTYAGYYMDHRAGGIMHIGFTENQAEQLDSLRTSLPLVAAERLQVYPTAPTDSYLSVRATSQSVSDAIESNTTLEELVVNVREDEAGKAVYVGTPDVAQVESILDEMLGPAAPVVVEYDAGGGSLLSGRFRNKGRMRAGDFIVARHYSYPNGVMHHDGNESCTAGFGAKDKGHSLRGDIVWRLFVLTAGHCTGFEAQAKEVFRSTDADPLNEDNWKKVGNVARDAFTGVLKKVRTDAEAIRVYKAGIVPQVIFGWKGNPIPTGQAGRVRKGNTVCFSGAKTQVPQCGKVVARSTRWRAPDGVFRGGYWVKFNKPAIKGDSGAPVWAIESEMQKTPSIGLITAARGNLTETLVEPLLHPYKMPSNVVPGILNDPSLRPLSLKRRR
ncbi:MAG: hypothetical protein WD404_06745, partial [Solirubrobacterales bacterium]